jgi:DNA-binding XRE family transcriptional regulator
MAKLAKTTKKVTTTRKASSRPAAKKMAFSSSGRGAVLEAKHAYLVKGATARGRMFVVHQKIPDEGLGSEAAAALREEIVEPKLRVKLTAGMVIKELREKHGWTQSQLAEKSGIAQPAISGLESGIIVLGLDRAKELAKAFGVHPAVIAFPNWRDDGEE